jgi:flagellar protein FliO/FliZ
MVDYVLHLVIVIPLIGLLIWGSLWLWRKLQHGVTHRLSLSATHRPLDIVDALTLGVGIKLVVVRYRDRELVVAVNRSTAVLLCQQSGDAPDD